MIRLFVISLAIALAFFRPLCALARSAVQNGLWLLNAVRSLAVSDLLVCKRILAGGIRRLDWFSADGLGFVLSTLFVALVLVLFVRWVICRIARKFASADIGHGYDSPIACFADDRLSRAAYVDMLLHEIAKAPDGQPQVIGIYGAWGEGKTSVVRLLETRCRERKLKKFRFIWFLPWSSVVRKEVNAELFTCIGRALCGSWHPMLALAFLRYASQKTIGWLPRPHGLFELMAFAIAVAMNAFTTFDWVKRQLVRKLEELDGRLVVVIDDLDRLEGKEVCEIVRCVKANGDLPNVTYLLLSDEARLVKLAAPLFGDDENRGGRDGFLEKIVTQPLPLWPTPPEALRAEAEKLICREVENAGADFSEIKQGDISFCLEQFKTLRQIKRLACALSANLSYYRAQAGAGPSIDLHMGDVLRLTALRLCLPEMVGRLYAFYKNWCEESFALGYAIGLEIPEDRYRKLLSEVKDECRAWFGSFMKDVMHVREKQNGAQKFFVPYGIRDVTMSASFRLASPAHFERYFNHFELPASVCPRHRLESFVQALKDPGEMVPWLQAMSDDPLATVRFLDYLRAWDYPIGSFSTLELVRGLVSILEQGVHSMAAADSQFARLVHSIRLLLSAFLQRRKAEISRVAEDGEEIVTSLIDGKRHVMAELLILTCAGQVHPTLVADDLLFETAQLQRLWEWVKQELAGKIFDPAFEARLGSETIARLYNEIVFDRSADDVQFFSDHVEYLKAGMKMPQLIRRLKTLGAYVTYSDPEDLQLVFHGVHGMSFAKHYPGILMKAEEEILNHFELLQQEGRPVILAARAAYQTPFSAKLDARLAETERKD